MELNLLRVLSLVLLNFPADLFGYVVIPSTNPLAVGQNVTLNLVPPSNINVGTWSHETSVIVIFYPNGESVTNTYKNRVTFNRTSLELSIRYLQLNDSGQYILQGTNPDLNAAIPLSVQEPISNVTLRANAIDLVELNNTAVLTCSTSSGTSLSYRWLNGSSVVTASGVVQLGEGNSTLTLNRVTRYDEGPFRCKVFNGISNETSQPIHLNIRYGPSNPTLVVNPNMGPGNTAYRTASNITLSCSAQSNPPASYMWKFNGAFLKEQSPQLTLQNIRVNQTGNYTCLAYNNVTLRYAIINTIINIVEPITVVVLNSFGKLPILDESFTLRCEVTVPVDHIHWLMNGKLLPLNNRTGYSMDNNSIVITSIQFSDSGKYQCEAFNAVSNMTSMAYTLVVNYGPLVVNISLQGPTNNGTGFKYTMTCSANSQPASEYQWKFNNQSLLKPGTLLVVDKSVKNIGNYTCVATNSVTKIKMSKTISLDFTEPSPAPPIQCSFGLMLMLLIALSLRFD
ncbi:hypothetical protein UPYG_G00152570 [Umbra pygmaea]|uniref:Ig-like domain-containing protein n=1 Tax=Umbra pygmaea TaxID=75934 RepID=A0ABD0WXS2_UMBPY